MTKKKNIFAINGSASKNSSNLAFINQIIDLMKDDFDFTVFNDLTKLPHFQTELTDDNTPNDIVKFRNSILNADAILISTPEYVFSIPSGLKNVIEWCVSTTVFSNKPIGLITASAGGEKGHEELKLIMKTVERKFTEDTTLLIQGVRGKIDREGNVLNKKTENDLIKFVKSFSELIKETST